MKDVVIGKAIHLQNVCVYIRRIYFPEKKHFLISIVCCYLLDNKHSAYWKMQVVYKINKLLEKHTSTWTNKRIPKPTSISFAKNYSFHQFLHVTKIENKGIWGWLGGWGGWVKEQNDKEVRDFNSHPRHNSNNTNIKLTVSKEKTKKGNIHFTKACYLLIFYSLFSVWIWLF